MELFPGRKRGTERSSDEEVSRKRLEIDFLHFNYFVWTPKFRFSGWRWSQMEHQNPEKSGPKKTTARPFPAKTSFAWNEPGST